ncbi:MAG: cytochrome-c peroxidase [Bacteroidetes bacterium]|nr:cytochrome-c peroxidase [Bacteroidota bacterium]
MKSLTGIFMLAVLLTACSQQSKEKLQALEKQKADSLLLTEAKNIFDVLPSPIEITPANEPLIKLGQMLFYDPRLSSNEKISCNSCHNLASYGVDNKPTSTGASGAKGDRNSPTVFNAAIHNMQFWDGRARNVEEQAGMPILNKDEMAIPHEGFLVQRLDNVPDYKELFKTAFPDKKQPVTYENVQKAIGAFERTLLTPSRFDKFMMGNADALTDTEKSGLRLFMNTGCTSCHNGVGIGGTTMQKFGLVTDYRTLTHSRYNDEGRKNVTRNERDKDVFKVQGLRNVEKTYPYFHDGSITSLDTTVKIMSQAQLNKKLTDQQIKDIVAFLKSLTGDIRVEAKINPFAARIK